MKSIKIIIHLAAA